MTPARPLLPDLRQRRLAGARCCRSASSWCSCGSRTGPRLELRAEIRPRPRRSAPPAGAPLVVNDHWRIAIDEGCDFVHLGQEDLDGADLAAIRRAGLRLGV